MSEEVKSHTLVLRIKMDCLGCYNKVRKALMKIYDIHSHVIEKKENKVTVSGPFEPEELVKQIAKKTRKKVEVLESTINE
ncbi:heavy metal-associated isoprenylated plant protein 20 [Cryptomeria japonica]|uniref:heavy metal-associated isoprenylated plant protein 20 n=1 Tax=Cryptomeria japonica TaxID=3369 RepID=UPI0025AB7E84|nr:heavy metal-associated isoprenylated plant protein 20 [Cryptomeria japonica]